MRLATNMATAREERGGREGETQRRRWVSVRVEKKRKDGQEISKENTRQKKPLSEVS